jgi:hypothetical protein
MHETFGLAFRTIEVPLQNIHETEPRYDFEGRPYVWDTIKTMAKAFRQQRNGHA